MSNSDLSYSKEVFISQIILDNGYQSQTGLIGLPGLTWEICLTRLFHVINPLVPAFSASRDQLPNSNVLARVGCC